ncbi:glycosyltransferase [Cloacibacterium sp. Arc13]|uniref:glycosyltransferase n=1 Tax=unclassified Cloacibacterium TaxID=2620870 RepID=UPI00352CB125
MHRLKQKIVFLRNHFIYKKWDFLAKINQTKLYTDPKADFVVSIATYPKRAHLLPAVFEALNQQTQLPQKWIVVLTEEEWPGLQLPKYLNKLINRGIEIVWVKNNSFAVKKLLPVMQKYPDLGVITLDDDIIYHKSLVRGLLNNRTENPETIVGYVGKAMVKKENQLHMYYREKNAANKNTPSSQVYLIGWGGIYYPAGSLHEKAFNEDQVRRIVPGRGSDIWFWAAAIANNTNQICLGLPKNYNLGVPIPQNDKTKPKDRPKTDVLLERFQMAIDYFELRERLIKLLPNK